MQKNSNHLRRAACAFWAATFICLGASAPTSAAQSHLNRTIEELQPPQAGTECVFFRVSGSTLADPAVPGSGPYFALGRTHVGFKEIYALLLATYSNGGTISVKTTGAEAGGSCGGYVGVAWVIAP